MNNILKLIDSLLAKLPPSVVQMIRLGALLVWLVLGTVVAILAWASGTKHAPQSGGDLSLSELREKIKREKNEKESAPVTIPDIGEFAEEERKEKMPFSPQKERPRGLSGTDERLIEPENPIRGSGELPPFLGDQPEPYRDSGRSALPPDRSVPEKQPTQESIREPRPGEKRDLNPKKPAPGQNAPGNVPGRDKMPGLLPMG